MFRSKALRPIAGVVLVTFSALTLQPLTAAAQLPPAPSRGKSSSETGEERFSRTLNEIHEILKEVVPHAAMPHMFKTTAPTAAGKPGEKVLQAVGPKMRLESERAKPLPGIDIAAKVKSLRGKYKELKSLEAEVTKGFKETEKHLRDKNLPPEILARHEATVAEYERRKAEFNSLMQLVEAAADAPADSAQANSLQGALASLGEFMAKYPNAKAHTPTDPNNLPWGSPKPVTRAPYTSPAQFKTSRLFGDPVKVAQAGSLSGISLPTTVLPLTPIPADLAATEDAQITQAIKDLAASLNNQPVAIYNWVRNNIRFVPSYGSIQGSDMTLQTKRGNAFDTASLLIALFRAANIPARYVYGTIEVPADRAMNWVGGVTVPQAAISLMNQGGIPSMGIGLGGQVRSIRLEHVWVEAFVDYNPSRGAVNRNPNTWVPMDASFKQYQFTQGMDIKTNVPFDANSFITQIQQGATINVAEGWVQNVSQTLVEQSLSNYQTQVTNYVNAQKPSATVGDVLGTQTIVQENRPILLGTLPYARIATGAKFQTIPDNLRHKLRMKLYTSEFDRGNDSPAFVYSASLPVLAGKRLSLTYDPATPADKAVIDNAFSSFQLRYPAYLVRITPSLKVEDAVVRTGGAVNVGESHFFVVTTTTPFYEHEGSYPVTSGDLSVLVADPVGITPDLFSARTSRQDLRQGNIPNATEEMLYQVGLGYWGEYLAFKQIAANSQGIRFASLPGHGMAALLLTVQYSFGIARMAGYTSRSMDVRENFIATESSDANQDSRLNYLRAVGRIGSFLEGAVFEQLFLMGSDQAISSVSALKIANQQGIPIYTITGQNLDAALGQLSVSAEVKARVQNAVAVGYSVTIPRDNMTIGNFTGTGYIIEDPQSGAAFYEISGGRQGGGAPGPTSPTPLPQFPANAAATFLMSAAFKGIGAVVVEKEGAIIGVALPRLAASLSLGTAAAIMGALAVGMLIGSTIASAQARAIEERYPLASRIIRHYTRLLIVPLINQTGIILGSLGGAFGPGVYLEEPPNQVISCPPTPVESAAITALYGLPLDTGEIPEVRANGFVELEITRAGYWDPIIVHPNAAVPTETLIPLLFVYFGPGAVAIRRFQSCPG